MPRIYKDGVLYNTSPSTASQLPYDNNTSTKDKIDSKMDKANPTGTGALSINRKANTTTGDRSVALGYNCTASGNRSVAIGDATTASGHYSCAINSDSIASGNRSFAQGQGTKASGTAAVSEGQSTVASGDYSYAQGFQTISNHKSQHVFGEYNVEDTSQQASDTKGTYIEIVGNGTSDSARSNARTLDWSGNEVLAGDLTINGSTSVGSTLGAKMDKANPTGTGSFSLNRLADSIIGTNSFAEGENCTASGSYSHAEGVNTIASSGATHAEGSGTKASGSFSHAEGYGTEANHRSQHVFGENNIPDNSGQRNIYRGNYVEIVGNGANSESKSNARTLDWNGNEVLAGGLSINGNQPVAPKTDIASISITGTTNNTGSSITSGIVFYLNGNLVRALKNISAGETLTDGTNYSRISGGGVNWVSYEYQCPLSTSTTSFQSIDPYMPSSSVYMGGVLDLLHTNRSSYTDGTVSNIYLARGGPAYGITLMKVNNNYYSGMIWGYHDSCWNTIWLFSYKNGTYSLRPMAYETT